MLSIFRLRVNPDNMTALPAYPPAPWQEWLGEFVMRIPWVPKNIATPFPPPFSRPRKNIMRMTLTKV